MSPGTASRPTASRHCSTPRAASTPCRRRAKDAIAVNRHHRGYIAPGIGDGPGLQHRGRDPAESERILLETLGSAARPPGGLAARRPQPVARSGRFPRGGDGVRGRRRSRAPFWSIPAISCRSGAADAGARRRTGSSTRRTGTAIPSPGSTTPRSTPGSRRSTVRPGTFHRCRRRSDMATMSWPSSTPPTATGGCSASRYFSISTSRECRVDEGAAAPFDRLRAGFRYAPDLIRGYSGLG